MANVRNGPPGGRWTRADAARRAALGWELRVAGRTWDEIAEEAGYQSGGTACRAVTRFAGELPQVDVDAMRRTATERGEALWREAWADVQERRPGAVTAAVRVLGRQAELLGLDAPSRAQVVVAGGLESLWTELYATPAEPLAIEAEASG